MLCDPTTFKPHPLLRSGHLQTVAGALGLPLPMGSRRRPLRLCDGDTLILHDDCPAGWRVGDPVALMIHGLGGEACSSYLTRIARKLEARGIRSFRLDMRCAGSARFMCRKPYHAGRSEDIAESLDFLAGLCPGSPVLLAGFSLGGAICLKMLGERGRDAPRNLAMAMAICPPVDLAVSARFLRQPSSRLYDTLLLQTLLQQFDALQHYVEGAEYLPRGGVRPRNLHEFDETITAPFFGYATAADYYAANSAAPLLPRIAVPTLIIAADDDPVVPASPWQNCRLGARVRVVVTRGGGHLGFFARGPGNDPDWRWMDWRVVEAARHVASPSRRWVA